MAETFGLWTVIRPGKPRRRSDGGKIPMVYARCACGTARNAGYAWLSQQMGLPPEQTHIGMFDVDQCKRVVEICKRTRSKPEAAAA